MTKEDKQRVTLFINPAISRQARAQAIIEGTNLTTLVEKALIDYLPEETLIKKAHLNGKAGP